VATRYRQKIKAARHFPSNRDTARRIKPVQGPAKPCSLSIKIYRKMLGGTRRILTGRGASTMAGVDTFRPRRSARGLI
jgi:hypothetical protein